MVKKEEKLKALGIEILEVAGGEGNISQVSHCYTRLRLTIKDSSKADQDKLKAIDGVLGLCSKRKWISGGYWTRCCKSLSGIS